MKWPGIIVLGLTAAACGVLLLASPMLRTDCSVDCPIIAKSDLFALAQALENYAADHGGEFPPNLGALFDHGDGRPAYLKYSVRPVRDPWKRPYLYESKADVRSWRLACLGFDGKPGGNGDASDLSLESK